MLRAEPDWFFRRPGTGRVTVKRPALEFYARAHWQTRLAIDHDVLDVPRSRFLVAGEG
jgi:hypothetical protein